MALIRKWGVLQRTDRVRRSTSAGGPGVVDNAGGVDAEGCYSPAADAAPPGVDGGGGGSVGRTSTSLAAAFIDSISSNCCNT